MSPTPRPPNKALHLSCGLICLAPLTPLREAASPLFSLGLASEQLVPLRHTQVNAKPLGSSVYLLGPKGRGVGQAGWSMQARSAAATGEPSSASGSGRDLVTGVAALASLAACAKLGFLAGEQCLLWVTCYGQPDGALPSRLASDW